MTGARPLYLSAGFVLEEGFPIADLRRIVDSMAAAAAEAGVQIVTGDTKVVERGKADGCYITTAGVGALERDIVLSATGARPGDRVLVSGPIGDHGITVMLARGELDIVADVASDTASLHGITADLLDAAGPHVRCLRDATRGGVATICNEVATASGVAVVLDEKAVPVRPVVNGASELLGIDPLYVACEGRLVAVVAPEAAEDALAALTAHPLGDGAAIIGTIADDPPGLVLLKTSFGGTRIVDLLVGDPLPRIC
jgi:hydrogenase expression/formation protein HypE